MKGVKKTSSLTFNGHRYISLLTPIFIAEPLKCGQAKPGRRLHVSRIKKPCLQLRIYQSIGDTFNHRLSRLVLGNRHSAFVCFYIEIPQSWVGLFVLSFLDHFFELCLRLFRFTIAQPGSWMKSYPGRRPNPIAESGLCQCQLVFGPGEVKCDQG